MPTSRPVAVSRPVSSPVDALLTRKQLADATGFFEITLKAWAAKSEAQSRASKGPRFRVATMRDWMWGSMTLGPFLSPGPPPAFSGCAAAASRHRTMDRYQTRGGAPAPRRSQPLCAFRRPCAAEPLLRNLRRRKRRECHPAAWICPRYARAVGPWTRCQTNTPRAACAQDVPASG